MGSETLLEDMDKQKQLLQSLCIALYLPEM